MNFIRLGICVLTGCAVLAFGGVEAWGQATLEIGAAVLFGWWAVAASCRKTVEIRWNWLYVPMGGLAAVALAQYAFRLSVYPYQTKIEFLKWCAYILLFLLTVESIRTERHLKQFVWFLLCFGFAVSIFAIVQHFTFDGKLYWLIPAPADATPFGPFVNANHFAGFLELVVPFGLALLLFPSRRQERENVMLLALFTIVPVGALILSASRGGVLSLLLELALLVFLSRAHLNGRKRLWGAASIAFLAAGFTLWLGVSATVQRFEQLTHGGIARELRTAMYGDTWRIFSDHPWIGTGVGTLVTVYPEYASFYDGRIVDHSHNDFLELLAETGLIGGFLGLSFVALLLWQGFQRFDRAKGQPLRAIRAGALIACLGLMVHGLVDFNFHIPSNALLFLLLAGTSTTEIAAADRIGRFARPEHWNVGWRNAEKECPCEGPGSRRRAGRVAVNEDG